MAWILYISLALAVGVADFAVPPPFVDDLNPDIDGPPPNITDNIWDTNLRLFPNLIKGNEATTTFKDGKCNAMQGLCLGEDGKTPNWGEEIKLNLPEDTKSALFAKKCREACQQHTNIGGCQLQREEIKGSCSKHKYTCKHKFTCKKYGAPSLSGDENGSAKCWNMLKCGTDNTLDLLEGDIIKTDNVKKALAGTFDAIKGARYKWPKNGAYAYIPYTMYGLGAKGQQRVRWAVSHISRYTCVRWVPRSNQRDYVSMFNGGGCYSMIGKQGNSQKLSLGGGCLYDSGTTVHEMLHAMGWYHEQSRDDRDSYIKIYWNNIASAMRYNFQKYNGKATTYGLTYDKKSVMQYGNTAFGSGRVTMEDKTNKNARLGQRIQMTNSDIASVNIHYNCDCATYSRKADGSKGGYGCEGTEGGGTKEKEGGGGTCIDSHGGDCAAWARNGECSKNPEWMGKNCAKSCDKCIKPKPSPAKVDGGWSDWKKIGSCSKSCGSGLQTKARSCDKPPPKNGGQDCAGPKAMTEACKVKDCPGKCEDMQPFCVKIATFCTKNPWVKANCKKSCDTCPRPPTPTRPPPPPSNCKDKSTNCPSWAKSGFCKADSYKAYMTDNCKKSCLQKC